MKTTLQRLARHAVHALAWVFAPALAGLAPAVHAAYPDQPIKLVVGFPPGGGGDTYGRLIAEHLGKAIGHTVIVENKPGAGGNLAADAVAKAKPDGYTLLLAMSGNMALAPVLRGAKLPYKVPDDFAPIGMAVEAPHGLFVAASSKYRSAQELFAAAKGGKLSFGSTGAGGAAHIAMELVLREAGLQVLHVPYKGSGPAITDLIGGQIDMFFATAPPVMGQVAGGKLRLLAITGPQRNPAMPEVPTFKELGVDVVVTQWYGVVAPAGTPHEAVELLTRGLSKALASAELKRAIRQDGAVEVDRTGDAFRQYIVDDIAAYRRGVTPDLLKTIE